MTNTNEHDLRDDPRLTAYALGEELGAADRAEIEALLESDAAAREELAALRTFTAQLESVLAHPSDAQESGAELSDAQRDAVRECARTAEPGGLEAMSPPPSSRRRPRLVADRARRVLAAAGVLAFAGVAATLARWGWKEYAVAESEVASFSYGVGGLAYGGGSSAPAASAAPNELSGMGYLGTGSEDFFLGASERRTATLARRGQQIEMNDLRQGLGQLGGETEFHTEAYDSLAETGFTRTDVDPRSTFSVDVDTASYANVRRFLKQGQLPPPDAVRIEELLNYFPWSDAAPEDGSAFAVTHQVTAAPWNPSHRLVRFGVQAREVSFAERESANLVFLLDVSGSMNSANKLPLLVSSLSMLVEELRADDRVAIVAYAGSSGLVLPSTAAADAPAILTALERLQAGGSTNGGAGIELAYRVARDNYVPGGINRVILATDGDFNVGVSDRGSLVRMLEREAESGVQLTALGFGMGNLKDATLEELTNKGDGNYAYVDSLREARKVLVEELGGTLVTVARDTKLQVEWNPAAVGAWRLLGYENRRLQHQDFEDDTVDAAEVGSGHHVTVLFELVPRGLEGELPGAPPLRYAQEETNEAPASSVGNGELGFFKLRHLMPNSDAVGRVEFALFDEPVALDSESPDLAFAAAVAGYGLLLSDSRHAGDLTYEEVFRLAQLGLGADPGGYRTEFVQLVLQAQLLARQQGWDGPGQDEAPVRRR